MSNIKQLSDALFYIFSNKKLAMVALNHPSVPVSVAGKDDKREYQRLEFLGDAAVGVAISEKLYYLYPDKDEGALALMKANIISASAMSKIAKNIGLDRHVNANECDMSCDKVLANTLEAVIGAVYVDGGYEAAKRTILILWHDMLLLSSADLMKQDAKSLLQQYSLKVFKALPKYCEESRMNEEGMLQFESKVCIDGADAVGIGMGRNKKIAQTNAAESLLSILESEKT